MPRTGPPGGPAGGPPPPVGIAGLPDNWAALWAYLDREAFAPLRQFEGDVAAFAKVSVAAAEAHRQQHRDTWNYWQRPIGFSLFHLWGKLLSGLIGLAERQRQAASAQQSWMVGQLAQVLLIAVRFAGWLVARERRLRRWQVARAEAQAVQGDKALHALIEREAAAGYQQGLQGRDALVVGLLQRLAEHNPLSSRLIQSVITAVLDLASVEDPVARLVLGKLLQLLADRLGVEKIAGRWAADMLAPILGRPRPNGLTQVIADTTARLTAVEGQWAQFYADGGSEVEQAGREWQQITGPLTDLALLAFLGAAVAEPTAWARDVSATLGAVVNDTIDGAAALIREV